MSNLIGQSLGRYHILEQLGEGGMAVVYKAYDTHLESDVAIKIIRTEMLAPALLERALKRFEREAKALARLTHPNIVKVMDYGEYEGKPYLVMPYLPGGTLKSKLKNGPMPWQEAAQILIPIASALGYAHKHDIIHRDVKPANVLITENGQPMLSDFGVAKLLDIEDTMELTGTGVGIGTPEYMAPEQASNKVDARTDIYALGVVLYEMVTGHKPYTADTPMAVLVMHLRDPLPRPKSYVTDLPHEIENILLKALAKNPNNRYQTAAEFAKALEEILAARGKARTADKARNRWRIAAALVAAVLILFGLSKLTGGSSPQTAKTSESKTSTPFSSAIPQSSTKSAWTLPADFVYDNFDSGEALNPALWKNDCGKSAFQGNGTLTLGVNQTMESCSVFPVKFSKASAQDLGTFEAQLRVADDFHGTGQAYVSIMYRSSDAPGKQWWADCGLVAGQGGQGGVNKYFDVQNFGLHKTDYGNALPVAFNAWYTFRLEVDPETMTFSCYVDDELIQSVVPSDAEALRSAHFQYEIQSWRGEADTRNVPDAASATTYVDNVRIIPGGMNASAIQDQPTLIPSNPTMYDDFNNAAYDGNINTGLWIIKEKAPDAIFQQNGMLTVQNSGGPKGVNARLLKYGWFTPDRPIFLQADLMLGETDHLGSVHIYLRNDPGGSGPFQEVQCGIANEPGETYGQIGCWDRWNKWPTETWEDEYIAPVSPSAPLGTWHTVRIAVDPATMTFTYFIDGQEAGSHTPARAEELKNQKFKFAVGTHAPTASPITGYVDNVQVFSGSQTNSAPVIKSVNLRYVRLSNDLIVYQDISFSDADGDANYVKYRVANVTQSVDVSVKDSSVDISGNRQKSGATIIGEWTCGSTGYQVTLEAIILDKAGNHSNPVEYIMQCE